MDGYCDKVRDGIVDLVMGLLPEDEASQLQQHLTGCAACGSYADNIKSEDELLRGFFAECDVRVSDLADEAVSSVVRLAGLRSPRGLFVNRSIGGPLMRFAAAAVLFFVLLYFMVTLSWICEINECILYAAS